MSSPSVCLSVVVMQSGVTDVSICIGGGDVGGVGGGGNLHTGGVGGGVGDVSSVGGSNGADPSGNVGGDKDISGVGSFGNIGGGCGGGQKDEDEEVAVEEEEEASGQLTNPASEEGS